MYAGTSVWETTDLIKDEAAVPQGPVVSVQATESSACVIDVWRSSAFGLLLCEEQLEKKQCSRSS